jgi:hypothetical protein
VLGEGTVLHTRFFRIEVKFTRGGYGVDVGAEKEEEAEDVDDFEQDTVCPGAVGVGHFEDKSKVVQ